MLALASARKHNTKGNPLCSPFAQVVVLATSILSAEMVLATLPIQRLKRSTLFVDVLSVKVGCRSGTYACMRVVGKVMWTRRQCCALFDVVGRLVRMCVYT